MNALAAFAGKYLIFILALAAIIIALLSERTVRNSIIRLALLAFPTALLMAWVAGLLYYHTRPFVVEGVQPLISHQPDNGFPSDHTLLAMVSSGVLFVHNRKAGLLLGILGILIGIARVIAKLHYPIDILGGIGIAIASVGISWMILRKFRRRLS
jgi:undecaprenyl-diphosphatase